MIKEALIKYFDKFRVYLISDSLRHLISVSLSGQVITGKEGKGAISLMLPSSKNVDVLKKTLNISGKTLHNRIVYQPMEGCDGELDGSPSHMTVRRYDGFASGGPGLVWFEAVAVVHEGRANPRQLFITQKNLDSFKNIVAKIKNTCFEKFGFYPIVIMQATHSGRYSRPVSVLEPLAAYEWHGHDRQNLTIVSDDYLERLEQKFALATKLAIEAGFDGIDIKCCHRYLASELLSAYNRQGRYGGDFDNRTRFISNAVAAAKAEANSDFMVTSRLNMYDGFEYPYGFGVKKVASCLKPDFSEGVMLVKKLDLPLVNVTCGNPYVNPEVNRPVKSLTDYSDRVQVLLDAAKAVYAIGREDDGECDKESNDCRKRTHKSFEVVCSGISGLEEKSPFVAAGALLQGYCSLAGFGRLTFAYPDFVKDIEDGLDKKKVCITCAKCTELMRAGSVTGCVIRDEVYREIYRMQKAIDLPKTKT